MTHKEIWNMKFYFGQFNWRNLHPLLHSVLHHPLMFSIWNMNERRCGRDSRRGCHFRYSFGLDHWNFSHIFHWFIYLRTFIVNIRLTGEMLSCWEECVQRPSPASEPDERRNILSVSIRCRAIRCVVWYQYHSEVLNY